ncbi:hypothetical protein CJU89_2196 [Yarrowia sp. B02]|nr:hypothetical protein CJU89_2196 [Yarrowia sp. B02]
MDIFLQTLLGSVKLNQHADEESSYYEFFSGWISRQRGKWGVMTTKQYRKAVERTEEYLLTSRENGKLQLMVSEASLPWLVLSCHVLLGFSTDTTQISELLTFCGFTTVSEDVIRSIVEWSTYPPRLLLEDPGIEFALSTFRTLQKAAAKGKTSESIQWRRLGYQKLAWSTVYEHHLNTPGLIPMSKSAGIVFYALFSLRDDTYVLVFIDAVTEALQMTRQFRADDETDLAQNICIVISTYMDKYGHPKYFVLLNPLRKWLHKAVSTALSMLSKPSTSQFVAPLQVTADLDLTPAMTEPMLSSLYTMLQNEEMLKDYPPFNLIQHDSPWPSVFVENLHLTQFQLSCHHPNGEEQAFQNDPNFQFAKELQVVNLPSLETDKISTETFELLKCRPTAEGEKSEEISEHLLLQKGEEEVNADFATLLERSRECNIMPGREYPIASIDFVSRKMILHIWQCFKLRETKASNGQERRLDFDEIVHVLSRGHDVYKVINSDEILWQSRGVEVTRGEGDTIFIYIGDGSSLTKCTWWNNGHIGYKVISHESDVSFLPKTVEDAVEDDRRAESSVPLSESSEDEDSAATNVKAAKPQAKRSREPETNDEEVFGMDYQESDFSDVGEASQVPYASSQVPPHLTSLYDEIDPYTRETTIPVAHDIRDMLSEDEEDGDGN